jgi:hypothetical protein
MASQIAPKQRRYRKQRVQNVHADPALRDGTVKDGIRKIFMTKGGPDMMPQQFAQIQNYRNMGYTVEDDNYQWIFTISQEKFLKHEADIHARGQYQARVLKPDTADITALDEKELAPVALKDLLEKGPDALPVETPQ